MKASWIAVAALLLAPLSAPAPAAPFAGSGQPSAAASADESRQEPRRAAGEAARAAWKKEMGAGQSQRTRPLSNTQAQRS